MQGRYQLHSGLAYFAVADNLSKAAVALSEVPAFLLLLLYCKSHSSHGLQGLPAVAAIHSVHACLLAPICVLINTFNYHNWYT